MQTIAITQGDPAGIGPEIVAKAFRDAPDDLRGCFAVGDLATLRRAAQCIVRPGVLELPVAQIVPMMHGTCRHAACRCCNCRACPALFRGAASALQQAVRRPIAWCGRRVPPCRATSPLS